MVMFKRMRISIFLNVIVILFIIFGCNKGPDYYTKGVGIYPGDPSEDFGPAQVSDKETYKNIARLRAAYHSSSYDYNLTAQLVTDGIITERMPGYISVATNNGIIPKNEREWLLDHNSVTVQRIDGSDIWISYEISGGEKVPEITGIRLDGNVTFNESKPGGWQLSCSGSEDGTTWVDLGIVRGNGFPGQERYNPFARMRQTTASRRRTQGNQRPVSRFPGMAGPYGSDSLAPRPSFTFNFGAPPRPQRIINQSFEFGAPVSYRFYRVSMSAPSAEFWTFGNLDFFNGDTRLNMVPSANFGSAWMSEGTGTEWVSIDLGTSATFDRIKLYWLNKALKGSVQVSDDNEKWTDLADLPGSDDMIDELILNNEANCRYLRVLMSEPSNGKNYVLSEVEVYGRGGMTLVPRDPPGISDDRMYLSGGNWKVRRASEVKEPGETISGPDYSPDNWLIATVPGTVLVSYRNAGALPDPNFGDNQLMISESFFNSDFWYRDDFEVPEGFIRDRIYLNFDGINWKADVFVNGKKEGRIEGAFIRSAFDITDLFVPGQKNAIAVRIIKNDNIGVVKEQTALSPDKNGGILGADNPTFHATIGWDWIPTIRGRDIGIWNDVFISTSGPVTIENPLVSTDLPLPDTTSADISVKVPLKNHANREVKGMIKGRFGSINFEKEVTMQPLSELLVEFDANNEPALHIINPGLWWPNGYGNQSLYDVNLSFVTSDGKISDNTRFKSGIREMAFDETDQILSIYVNGRRFIGRGGNWGFPESNLEYRGREYDVAVAYHADMNFTMIRNWVGQTGDDEFYEACDRHGIMIWQDFWLANPADGPNPDNPGMFMENASDLVKRIRNHPSIGIYCGRNEGNPPEVLDTALRTLIKKEHPGLFYISNSSMGVVSGGGPYRALPVRDYYLLYGYNKLHSERGMPNVMTFESLEQTLPDNTLWPQNSLWGLHDYCLDGAQGAASFNQMVEKGFGKPENAEQFTEYAQWINYNGYRGMFEGRSKFRKGLLLWMSHPAWPSMVWQTYDYYFDPTAAYFGCKKASEPVHIQWNPVFDTIEVVNYSGGNLTGLVAKAQIINMDGSVQWEKEATIDSNEDSTVRCFRLDFPLTCSSVHFIKLSLSINGNPVSDNFYWRGVEDGNYQALKQLPKEELRNNTRSKKSGKKWILTTTLKNSSDQPVLMVRLKVVGKTSGDRILPVFYSDNFVSLMPGEEKVIVMKLDDRDTRGEKPSVVISGFNL